MTPRHDVVVLGGGPAGCAVSVLLARHGARVVLVERADYRAFRVGEHFAPSTRLALESLGCELPSLAECLSPSPGVEADWGTGGAEFRPYLGGRGFNVVRNTFDAALFAHAHRAGVNTYAGVGQLEVVRQQPGWRVAVQGADGLQQLEARLLIDASGRRSSLSRRFGARFERAGSLRAVTLFVPHGAARRARNAALAVEAIESGWLSLTPRSDGSIVTFYSDRGARQPAPSRPEALVYHALQASCLVRSQLFADEWLQARVRGVWPAFPRLSRNPCGDGWLAVGEAAIAFDPVSGSGVAFALETAFRAAELVASNDSSEAAGRLYREALADHYRTHLARRRDVYRQAAERFPKAQFWSQVA